MRFCCLLVLLLTAMTVKASIRIATTNLTYVDHPAAFGPRLSDTGIAGLLAEPEQDPTGCSIVEKPCERWIALLRRGGCSFITKVRNMQASGALAVAVGDPEHPGRWITMYAPGNTMDVRVPSVFLSQHEYKALLSLTQLVNAPLQVTLQANNFFSWPLIDILAIVIVSPAVMLFFVFVSWQIRRRQQRLKELAPFAMLSRLSIKKFNREKMQENEREECAICLEDYEEYDELRVLPCRHDFHASCVDAWLTTQKKFVSNNNNNNATRKD
ncbi:hypothetical protein BX666DRAFT_2021071 [Dichotomocladium elegans]|nr:hypothetical protein BX666DRAFT_2021071 [Dichotomocladium elegans]